MSDMEKANILHQLKSEFDVPPELLEMLLKQISNKDIKENFARITSGLTIEDSYKHIFSSLPWIKNISGLHQAQAEKYKKNFQIPDYLLLVENSQKNNFPLLIDVKYVKGAATQCSIIPKQKHTLRQYAKAHQQPLLIAIYWERFGYWTHNCLSHFGGKKQNKIDWQTAICNDLSHLLSDYTFRIDQPFYRKTIFPKPADHSNRSHARHKKYGNFDSIFIGKSIDKLSKEDELFYSIIIDANFNAKTVTTEDHENHVCLIEEFSSQPSMIKTSQWLLTITQLMNIKPSLEVNEMHVLEMARYVIVDLMHRLGYSPSYNIPPNKNACTDQLFELAYKDTIVMRDYLQG
ncbi:hypothetical protein [Pseudomonas sp. 35 E 8]|uniref:hypothetical protein n=1 Tax=Pseudomonas sp. 35 E 8 TaxID=1844103 RepID=UPI000812808D|nr:hypothetical protein [Pseudomonas sp. 35 E 8]CRM39189.1 hypothetical protein [Pseudomonas sp. 35 E 8]